jgi:NADPH:quinone reductase-like Zn-dependent oxidoreductase
MTTEDNMITDTPTTMRALVISGEGRPAIVKSVLVAQAAVGELLVKVAAVALKPTDWMYAVNQEEGRILGVDFAGTVISAGVEAQSFKPGERIAGLCTEVSMRIAEVWPSSSLQMRSLCGISLTERALKKRA